MKTIYINNLEEVFNKEELSVMLGNFDGFHRGHAKLLEELLKYNTKKAMLTFYPHPLEILKNTNFKYLDTILDKEEYLSDKLDYLIVLKTSKEMLSKKKEEFIKFLKNNNTVNVVCGRDYTFGALKEGTIEDLKCFNINVTSDFKLYNKRVSSTDIRNLLKRGKIVKANILLGHNYTIRGIVSKGNQLGRTIGFRTANIEQNDYLFPKNGVYFGYVTIENTIYYSMINIGNNPTVGNTLLRLEAHIFDFDQDIYNKEIKVSFLRYIRDEKKFSSLEELKEELARNKEYCINLISAQHYF